MIFQYIATIDLSLCRLIIMTGSQLLCPSDISPGLRALLACVHMLIDGMLFSRHCSHSTMLSTFFKKPKQLMCNSKNIYLILAEYAKIFVVLKFLWVASTTKI